MIHGKYRERTCEQTGHDSCPLVGPQIPRTDKLMVATTCRITGNLPPVKPHAGYYPLDRLYTPKRVKHVFRLKTL